MSVMTRSHFDSGNPVEGAEFEAEAAPLVTALGYEPRLSIFVEQAPSSAGVREEKPPLSLRTVRERLFD